MLHRVGEVWERDKCYTTLQNFDLCAALLAFENNAVTQIEPFLYHFPHISPASTSKVLTEEQVRLNELYNDRVR